MCYSYYPAEKFNSDSWDIFQCSEMMYIYTSVTWANIQQCCSPPEKHAALL